MKLLSLHIEKFGNLSDFSMDFSEGCNKVLKENGWGKSTLAAFLRVMFYGLEGKNVRKDISENDKNRFTPWDGGVFGGSVTFEADGKRYVLSRNFSDKTKGKAVLQDADTLLLSNDFSDKIGEELFGIDSDSFKKTAFIDHDNIRYLGANSRIASRVSNLSQVDDLDRFDAVNGLLSEYVLKYSDTRRTGMLFKLNEEIRTMENELKNRNRVHAELEKCLEEKQKKNEETEALKNERKVLTDQLNEISAGRSMAANLRIYSGLSEACNVREQEYLQKKNVFPLDIPGDAELKELSELCRNAENAKLLLKRAGNADTDDRYEHLKRYFHGNLPAEEEVISKINSANRMQRLTEENEVLEKEIASKKAEIDTLEDGLSDKKRMLSEKESLLISLKRDVENEDMNSASGVSDDETEEIPKTSGLFFTFAAILLAVGIISVILYFAIFRNIVVLGGGILLMVIGFILFLLGSMRRKKERVLIRQKEKLIESKKAAAMLQKKEECINAEYEVKKLSEEISGTEGKCNSLREEITEKRNRASDNRQNIEKYETELKEFLNRYEIPYSGRDVEDMLYEMKSRIPEYLSLENNKKVKEEERSNYQKQSRDADEKLGALYEKLGGVNSGEQEPDFEKIRFFADKQSQALTELQNAEREYRAAKEKADEFISAHPELNRSVKILSEEEIELETKRIGERIAEIDAKKETISGELADIQNKINTLSHETDKLHTLSETLQSKKEEADVLSKKYEEIKLTQEYLCKAKDRFVARYMAPIKDRFDHYMEIMARTGFAGGDEYQIDAKLSLRKKELGSYHDIACLSDGYSDMIGICIRLALLDVMYQNEKPMIIMDDPFINLDRNHLAGAREFLDIVAQEYQILYFTCHEDRM